MNVVLCSGVMRSASTWSYHVCRAIIGAAAQQYEITPFSSYLEGEDLDEFLKQNPNDVAVLKTHRICEYALRLIHNRIVKNVCTVRDPRDCVASRQQFKDEPIQTSIDMVNGSFVPAKKFGRETLFVDYEEILADPVGQVRRIMSYLGLSTTQDQLFASAVANELSLEKMGRRTPDQGVDPEWELHVNHIHNGDTGKWRTILPDPEGVERSVLRALDWYRDLFPTGDHHAFRNDDVPRSLGL